MGFGQDLTESQVCFTELDSGQQTGLSVSLLDSINALSDSIRIIIQIIAIVSFFSLFTVLLLLVFYIVGFLRGTCCYGD